MEAFVDANVDVAKSMAIIQSKVFNGLIVPIPAAKLQIISVNTCLAQLFFVPLHHDLKSSYDR